jgi:hypothetical protein
MIPTDETKLHETAVFGIFFDVGYTYPKLLNTVLEIIKFLSLPES